MIAVAKVAIKDDHRKWSRNFHTAPFFDVKTFQDKLNKIAGLTQVGEPVLRLTWAGNESCFEVEGSEWVEKPRYAFLSRQQHNYGQAIPIRRWMIEENTDPQQLEAMGGKDGKIKVAEKGYYAAWLVLADHSKCPKDCHNKKMCYGDYRAPNDTDLDYIAEVTYQLLADKNRPDPRQMVAPEMIVPYLEKPLDEKDREEKDEQENQDFMKSWLKVHGVGRVQNTKHS